MRNAVGCVTQTVLAKQIQASPLQKVLLKLGFQISGLNMGYVIPPWRQLIN